MTANSQSVDCNGNGGDIKSVRETTTSTPQNSSSFRPSEMTRANNNNLSSSVMDLKSNSNSSSSNSGIAQPRAHFPLTVPTAAVAPTGSNSNHTLQQQQQQQQPTPSFCVRWRGFHGNLSSSLEWARDGAAFADVTLSCDGGATARAHRLVLAAASGFFDRVLRMSQREEEAESATATGAGCGGAAGGGGGGGSCCDHRVVILLGDVDADVLAAILSYVYVGQAFIPENKLSSFFSTAASLEIKGIGENPHAGVTTTTVSASQQHEQQQQQQQQSFAPPVNMAHQASHPVGDLSLLAAAATASVDATTSSRHNIASGGGDADDLTALGSGRRKAVPRRRLDAQPPATSPLAPPPTEFKIPKLEAPEPPARFVAQSQRVVLPTQPVVMAVEHAPPANESAINLSVKSSSTSSVKSGVAARAGLLTIPNPSNFASLLRGQQAPSCLSPMSAPADVSSAHRPPRFEPMTAATATPPTALPPSPVAAIDMTSPGGVNGGVGLGVGVGGRKPRSVSENDKDGLLSADDVMDDEQLKASATPSPPPPLSTASTAPAPVTRETTPEQMAALLGPAWKSRQPRLCQYCQRMFSNKFNLKQHILNMHTVGRELHCEICQKKVKNKWYLRRHHVTHHGAPLKK